MEKLRQGYIHIRDTVTPKRKSGAKQFPEKTQQRQSKSLSYVATAMIGVDMQWLSTVSQRHEKAKPR